MFEVRLLVLNDAAAFRALRLESLQEHPEAFGASYETEAEQPNEFFVERLENNTVFGGFRGSDILGIVGFYSQQAAKLRHKGVLWGMYVREAARGSGLASALLDAVVEHARGNVELLQLTVVTSNKRACRFYERCGFVQYGVEPQALRVDGRYYEEALMMMRLNSDESGSLD